MNLSDESSSGTTSSANQSDEITSGQASSANAASAGQTALELSVSGESISISLSPDVFSVISVIWIVGIVLILAYGLTSYLRLSRRMKTAVRLRANIYQSEWAKSPFLLGIIRPRIYIPWKISQEDEADSGTDHLEYVIAHEQAHIRRGDHWAKPIGFVLLAVYWFQPLVWVAYVLFCRDIEYACDEAVIRHLDAAHRADYSQTLLNCHVSQHRFAACPIAFGETSVKARVISVLNYPKPALWRIVIAVLLCVVLTLCFLTNPVSARTVAAVEQDSLTQVDAADAEQDLLTQGKTADEESAADAEQITHLQLQLTDQVLVDADVTPYETYKDGIAAYYADSCGDGVTAYTTDAVTESIQLFGKELEEQIALLEEYMGVELEYEERKISMLEDFCNIKVPDLNGDLAWIDWRVEENGLCNSELIYPHDSNYINSAHAALETMDLGNYELADVSEKIRVEAEEAKAFVSNLTGETLSDYSLCIPLEETGTDTWAFVFYYDLDGLPWMCQEIGCRISRNQALSQDVADRTDGEGLASILPMHAGLVIYQDGKPIGTEIPLFSQAGDVYIEQTAVLGLDDILKKASAYFDGISLTEDITITNIRMIYNTYYSDGTDGEEIRYVAYPFWCLQYYNDTAGYGNTCILFDAYTGDYISELKQDF